VTEAFPAALQDAVGNRYELRHLLGRGGMASVYLAYDHKHRREVAIKVLLPDLAASIGSDRFLTEIRIVARLNHPHVLGMHDSGETGGFLYYVMPFVEGGSLRQRLVSGRRLELAEALAIAQPVADALSYAHRMHVLHRDIKPENILFSQGFPIVADFGIAKAVSTAAGDVNLTRTGFPLGTPGYMSPEQAAGLSDLDERTDVYSFVVVIYEMLVGEVPGRWPTEDAVRAGRFLEAVPKHLGRLIGVVFGPIGGGMGGGGVGIIFSALMAAPLPILIPVVIPAWLLGTYGVARKVYKESAARRAHDLETLAGTLAALTRELIAERPLLP
jgi:eukaryotic-like serine/threonine-protein kinase